MRSELTRPAWVYRVLMLIVVALPLIGISAAVLWKVGPSLRSLLVSQLVAAVSADDRRALYGLLAQDAPGLWEVVPDPAVGRILQPNTTNEFKGAEVVSNNAGMRSRRPYVEKPEGVYRVVCLGDSYVMGAAGPEEDRWGDQIEEILRELAVRVDGREVEVYSLGLGSWTALNEASYLTRRLSAYDPDLVLVMMASNDISDTAGVMGIGTTTKAFTPEYRQAGSGVLHNGWPQVLGFPGVNMLRWAIGSQSQRRWEAAFAAWRRLEMLLHQRGARMLLGVLDRGNDELFVELVKYYHARSGMESPLLITNYFDERLEHDGHPNREGHRLLASHYLHTAAGSGWLPVRDSELPPLHPRLSTRTQHPADPERIAELKKQAVDGNLEEAIVFDRLTRGVALGILGGVYPGDGEGAASSHAFGSPKSAFLLRRAVGARKLVLEIEVPPRDELFPFELEMQLDGTPAATLRLRTTSDAGRRTLEAALPDPEGPAVEVTLTTDSHWSTIEDPTMRSYRLIAVRQE